MAETEMGNFNVKNNTLRLIGFATVLMPPGAVITVVDDPKGINRKSVSKDPFLTFTDEEATMESVHDISVVPVQEESDEEVEKVNEPVAAASTGKKVIASVGKSTVAAKTATGTAWGKK